MPPSPPPLDYRSPQQMPAACPRRLFSIAGLVCGTLLSLYLLWTLQRAALIAAIYRDFNLMLPTGTQVFIDVMWWIRTKAFYLPLLLPPLIGAFVLPLMDRLILRDPIRVLRCLMAMMVLIVLILLLGMLQDLVLESPMNYLISGMSGGNNTK